MKDRIVPPYRMEEGMSDCAQTRALAARQHRAAIELTLLIDMVITLNSRTQPTRSTLLRRFTANKI